MAAPGSTTTGDGTAAGDGTATGWRLGVAGLVQAVGAVLALAGVTLPWVTVSLSVGSAAAASRSSNGLEDGAWGIVAAALALSLGALAGLPRRRFVVLTIVDAGLLAGLAAYRCFTIEADQTLPPVGFETEIGAGLYTIIGGSLLVLAGALPRLAPHRQRSNA